MSATKWVTELEVTRFDRFDQYWVERGWDEQAPIKTMARIDTPRSLGKLTAGPNVIAGVAWAQTIGISAVEVSIDDGPFMPAQLADEHNVNTWRQWKLDWDAPPGRHRITARATDAAASSRPTSEPSRSRTAPAAGCRSSPTCRQRRDGRA